MLPCEDSKSVCPYPEKRNHHSFVNISPTLVIDTSMERSSRVLQHEDTKNWFFFLKSSKLNFDLCQKSDIVQVGLNMHLYDDIGDASSSLRESTSSYGLFSYKTYTLTSNTVFFIQPLAIVCVCVCVCAEEVWRAWETICKTYPRSPRAFAPNWDEWKTLLLCLKLVSRCFSCTRHSKP